VDRPNLMIKVPGSAQGWPAIERLLTEGINVNITLLFSLEHYREVAEAYLRALEARVRAGAAIDRLASVASFFVSRVDTEVDRRLSESGAGQGLQGRAAVAQAKLAYELFQQRFAGARWDAIAARGATLQRPLWASTSTKNPDYPDLLYVESLEGPNTVNTMPEPTINAFRDHGRIERTVDRDVDQARDVLARLRAAGVDMDDVAATLEREGVASFQKSYDQLIASLREKAAALSRGAA
jgi:transaldolase